MELLDCSGVGEATVKMLEKYGINTPEKILTIFPKAYKDTRNVTPIANLQLGYTYLIEGRISHISHNRFGRKFLKFVVTDNTASCTIVMFRFYPNQISMLENAETVRCYGKVDLSSSTQMVHPEWSIVKNGKSTIEQKISAVYRLAKISDKVVSNIVLKVLQSKTVENLLPQKYLKKYSLLDYTDSLYIIHALANTLEERYLLKARYSIKFEEMIAYKLAEESVKKDSTKTSSPSLKVADKDLLSFKQKFPYELTIAQDRTIAEILTDVRSNNTMIRLLQGDVGAGKTIVATMALYACVSSGYQAAIMAPTEILAEQHFAFLSDFFADTDIEVVPLLGKLTAKQTRTSLEKVSTLKKCIVVGTHAIFQERVEYNNLGLVVVDEQHRFGVEQRLALMQKGSGVGFQAPHQLIISATPIPRTLAMTLYGNLKLSILDELPPNRKPITTTILNRTKKQNLIAKLKQAVANKEQIYWVCPLVEESEELDTLQDVKSLHQELSQELGAERVGLVYGSMKSKEKVQVMSDFKAAKYDILVATTVIEVGVDVPNASIMIIDNAERLGISQLHQLRGRVGRGSKESYCILLYSDKISEIGKKRLSLIRESQDGFYLAEKDLEIRGAGDVLGKEQSGLSSFTTFDINEYYDSFEKVSELADEINENEPKVADKLIEKWFDKNISFVDV
ncbi:ATP-dependent DNA helicase RecG [Francisella adeliensis]|uniref:ATP-dependent DNA helicase RecG n=1 Tax=Francisella adeliensis TaxID=2007306 RepID=A0A2Z4Y0H6_9GAMM|nr:ATP-dependent DNA helicase RecG [Francisella adeliensis]AXA34378.1 ATP-dependent DNA helicase RecG [Francisella adeliensis]MBK2086469.1 ATP-dependent DNA helicase RecG [Francisella adeliensis]MBK2096097.1 ATP-dependent DNA helicase RecG [Francisella adeliensis]QIW12625.1 ATP-dependent DNA helicase RecG [Francisella adeliensis]QIW14499.1 ATP-dependent DNA helicase RecG [Francisella adeliensis]